MKFSVSSAQTMRQGLVSAEMVPGADHIPGIWNSWDILVLQLDMQGRRRVTLIDNRVPVEKKRGWFSGFNLLGGLGRRQ
jgi:hypothetical protein